MPTARPGLSLVIPIYNEEPVIPELERRLGAVLSGLETLVDSWEVVLVDDGSKDRSFELLSLMADKEPRYKIVSFARNFGHQMAITAGLDRAEGDAVVIMDADLQDPPEVIASMIEKWREGWDVVYGVRKSRKGEKPRVGQEFFKPLRQVIESVNATFKTQLGIERHRGKTIDGVCTRIAQRVLALTAAIWHNDQLGLTTRRSLTAYDH